MHITTVRIIVQIAMFTLFGVFVLLTSFSLLDSYPAARFWLSKFLEIDPLVAVSTAITTSTLYKGLIWSLLIIVLTVVLGRVFCNWICPFGVIHHFVGWLFNRRTTKERMRSNEYHKAQSVKYYVLIGMLVAALFGTLQIGLLDPIVFVYRAFTIAVLPSANMPVEGLTLPGGVQIEDPHVHGYAWIIGSLFLLFVGMNLVWPRFFCRVLCPLGALLGTFSRFALWRIERNDHECTHCNLCAEVCEGASDPHLDLRMSECFVCMNCIEACPHGALKFSMLPSRETEITSPDVTRRHAFFSVLLGALFFSWTRTSAKSTRDFSSKVIRPPGSVEEQEFLERCIKCAQCIRVCPTNVLQPTTLEAGLAGLWTPVMNYRVGSCQYSCTACGQVCPTGAIQRISPDQKLGKGPFAKQGPVKLGTAHYDLGRCLPWSKNVPCMVCEEVCPVSPKAIHAEHKRMFVREGKKRIARVHGNALTLTNFPQPGEMKPEAPAFRPHEFRGDQAASYHVQIITRDGNDRTYAVEDNDGDTIRISGSFNPSPAEGDIAALHVELKVPKIDTEQCIGCGACEYVCPVVGDQRAVYVMPAGETRSKDYPEERNRTLRLR